MTLGHGTGCAHAHIVIVSSRYTAKESETLTGQSSSVGVPSARKVVFNWSISDSPGRYGVRNISSAKIHPTDQMSTAVL